MTVSLVYFARACMEVSIQRLASDEALELLEAVVSGGDLHSQDGGVRGLVLLLGAATYDLAVGTRVAVLRGR